MAVKGLLTADDNYVASVPSAGSSDMDGPGETLMEHGSGALKLGAFDQAVAPKSGTSETPGKMKTSQFANTPHGGATEIGMSQALNLTGSKKAG